MDLFFGLIILAICGVWNILAVIGLISTIIWIVRKFSAKQQKPALDSAALQKWLTDKKEKGQTTIDDLLFLLKKDESTQREPAPGEVPDEAIQQKPIASEVPTISAPSQKIKPKTLPKKSILDNFSASILLYLGAGLIIFAVFVFVAFTWETYSNAAKSLILILFTFCMYGSGILFTLTRKIKQAGLAFLFIASVLFCFLGIGLWNFYFEEVLAVSFQQYWLYWSLLMVGLYAVTLRMLNLKRFFFLLLISIYSSFYTFSYVIADNSHLRPAIFLSLNLVFYSLNGLFGKYLKIIKVSSRGVNLFLNFTTLLVVTPCLFDQTLSSTDKIIAACSLLVPTLFSILTFVKERTNIEPSIEIILLPVKLLIICLLAKSSIETTFITLFLYASFITVLADYLKSKSFTLLFWISKCTSWTIAGLLSLTFLITWVSPGEILFSKSIQIGLILGISLLITVPAFLSKRKVHLSIALIYLIFAATRIFSLIHTNTEPVHFVLVALILVYSAVTLGIYFYQQGFKNRLHTLLPIIIIGSITTLLISLTGDALSTTLGFGLISFIILALSMTLKTRWLMLLSLPLNLIAYPAFLTLINDYTPLVIDQKELFGMLFLIPVFSYAFLFDFLYFKKKAYGPYLTGFFLFAASGLLLVLSNEHIRFNYLLILTLYSLYALGRFSKSYITYFVFSLSTLSLWAGLDICNANKEASLVATLCLWLIFTICNSLSRKYLTPIANRKLMLHFSWQSTVCTLIAAVPLFFLIPTGHSMQFVAAGMVLFLNLLMSDHLHELFSNLSGIGLLFISWHIFHHYDWNTIFVIPLTIYLLILALRYYLAKKYRWSRILEICAYLCQFTVLLAQSTYLEGTQKITAGLFLIVLATGVLISGLYRKRNELIYLALGFIFIELIIRLYVVIILIPWWLYLGLLGLGLMGLAVYILWKIGSRK